MGYKLGVGRGGTRLLDYYGGKLLRPFERCRVLARFHDRAPEAERHCVSGRLMQTPTDLTSTSLRPRVVRV